MQLITDKGPGGERVLALGTFDGVHRGHQELLAIGKRYAQEHGILLRACSFDRHPLEVLRPEMAPKPLTSIPEKAKLMEQYGADELQLFPFTREMADMEPEDFLRMLRETVSLKAVVAGWNYTFGKAGKGNAGMLYEDGAKHGYDVLIVPPVKTEDGETISSSLIRQLLKEGKYDEAEELLGHSLNLPDSVRGCEQHEQ